MEVDFLRPSSGPDGLFPLIVKNVAALMKNYRLVVSAALLLPALLFSACRTVPPIKKAPLPPPITPTPSPVPVPSPTPLPAHDIVLLFHSARSGSDNIYLKDFSDRSLLALTAGEHNNAFPSWSPDRDRIAFASDRDGYPAIYVMKADGSDVRRVSEEGVEAFYPSWSPDGRLAFFARREGVDNFELVDLEDGTSRKLTSYDEGVGGVSAFAPGGDKLVFGYERMGKHKLYQLNLDSGEIREIISHVTADSRISWHPGGDSFLYSSGKGNQNDIWRFYFRDGRFAQVTRDAGCDYSPALSPDGKRAAFVSRRAGGGWEVFVANLNDNTVPPASERLTFDGFDYRYPDWK